MSMISPLSFSRPLSKLLLVFTAAFLCGQTPVADAAKCPNIQLIMDHSGSTDTPLDTGSEWTVASAAVKKILPSVDGTTPIGMTHFPNTGCDSLTVVHPAYGTQAAISAAIDSLAPIDSSPVGTAVRDVAAITELHDASRAQYALLITDGGANCGGDPDTDSGTANEIAKAAAQSPPIITFVIGVGVFDSITAMGLNQMAMAGGRPLSGTTNYYPATTAAEMAASLNAVIAMIKSEVGVCSESGTPDMSGPRDMSMPSDGSSGGKGDMRSPSGDGGSGKDGGGGDGGNPGGGGSGLPAPVVDWIDPKEVTAGVGSPAEITGRNFIASVPASQVYFDSGSNLVLIDNALVSSPFNIKVSLPADMPAGTYDVVVKNPDGQIGTATAGLTVTAKSSGCSYSLSRSSSQAVPGAILGAFCLLLLLAHSLRRRRAG